jgi:myo-inositol-1(or 4)-monophosphatase
MHPMTNMALRAGRKAGQIIVRAMDRIEILTVEEKRKHDFVSEVDRNAEEAIIDVLHRAYPDHGIIGEESGTVFAEAEYTWIIDPLDGTANFLQGIPHFAVSIALRHGNQIEQAVIVDPVRNEEFVASRGMGAQLNGKRIRVSARNRLEDAVLGTGLTPEEATRNLDIHMAMLQDLTAASRALRRQGAAALDLAYVAAGRYEGFWQVGLKPWDIAAGALLVREAGGFVSDLVGGETFLETGNVVAGNPKVFKALLQALRPHLNVAMRKG